MSHEQAFSIIKGNSCQHIIRVFCLFARVRCIRVNEPQIRPVGNAQLLAFPDILQRPIHNDLSFQISRPTDVLMVGGMIEHRPKSKNHSLRLEFAAVQRPVVGVVIQRGLLDVLGVLFWIQDEYGAYVYHSS